MPQDSWTFVNIEYKNNRLLKQQDEFFNAVDILLEIIFTLSRLLTILDNDYHPLHSTLNGQRSIFSGRLLSLSCSSDRLRKSFVPRAIQLYNATQKGRGREMGLLCMSLPQSPLLISLYSIPLSIFLLAILAPCTDFTIYITLHYPHTHKYSIFALSIQAHEHYIFALLSSWTSTLSQSMHTVI